MKSFDIFVIIATTSSSITLSLKGIGLIAISISTATACGLSIGTKVVCEIFISKYNKHKEQIERDQQAIKSFDNLYRTSLENNAIDKNENESLCIFFTKDVDETKNETFL